MSESFSELFENSESQQNVKVGALLMGTVVCMNREKAVINVGLKSEGFISLSQFKDVHGEIEIAEGDVVEVALESIDDGLGHTLLSISKHQSSSFFSWARWAPELFAMPGKKPGPGETTGGIPNRWTRSARPGTEKTRPPKKNSTLSRSWLGPGG